MPLPKSHIDTSHTQSARMSEANGEIPPGSRAPVKSVEEVIAAIKAEGNVTPAVPIMQPANGKGGAPNQPVMRQTHGAVLPSNARITSVDQLLNTRRSVAKGSITSFDTVAAYRGFLDGLSREELSRHAVEEGKIVPIDDRQRLIRRLENEFTSIASRHPGHPMAARPTQPPGYSREQMDNLDELRRQMLRGRG